MSKGQETLTYLYSLRQKWAFLAVLFLVAASGYLDRNILPILFQPLKQEFGLSDRALGLLGGAPFALAFAVSSFPLAILADRVGRKPVLVGALTLWTLMTALCGFATGLPLLILGRMGVGLAEGGATPPAHALIAEYFPPGERGKAYGIHTTSSTAGALVAATAGGWIAAAYGWRSAFVGVALLSAPVCVLAQLVLREPTRGSSAPFKAGTFSINCRALFGKRSFVCIVLSLVAYSMLPYGVLLFMPTYLVRNMHI